MSESNRELKDSFDRYIGYERLVKDSDKEQFYEKLQKKEYNHIPKHWMPKLITAILIIGITSTFYMFSQSSSQLEQANDFDENYEETTSNETSLDEVPQKINEIISNFKVGMSRESVEKELGEPDTFAKVGTDYSRTSYIYDENDSFNKMGWGDSEGKYGMTFNILWVHDKAITAYISFLTENGRSQITFKEDGTVYKDGQFVENSSYQIEASNYLVKAIAESLNKAPEAVTEDDLLKVEKLTLEPEPDSKIYILHILEHDIPILKAMENLQSLHLKRVWTVSTNKIYTADVISYFKNLNTLSIDAVPLGDLDKLNDLKKLKTIKIQNNSELYVVELAKSESLEKIIIDNKDKLIGWEDLVNAGIEVLETAQ